ncbi:MAG: IS1096 element passenger TnpR family protein [Blastocatellia bacterium]
MSTKKDIAKTTRVYTFAVNIVGGPMTNAFIQANPIIGRIIQIRGDRTLAHFHKAIFTAFDRQDEHLYEFQVGGRMSNDPDARRYVIFPDRDEMGKTEPAGGVKTTRIDSLGLVVGEPFGYWFDYGDDWWHQVTVVSIEDLIKPGRLPRVIKKIGQSPPQYPA